MRLAGKEKGGYYPTMPLTLRLAERHFEYPAGNKVRLLDPCGGQAEAIVAVARARAKSLHLVETLVVELSPENAEMAEERLRISGLPYQLLNCGFEETILSTNSVGLGWVNPPYDWMAIQGEDDEGKLSASVTKRVEYKFLKDVTPKLQPNGVLAYLVPLSVLQRKQVQRYLAGNYTNFTIRSVPDPEYDIFKQVLVFATKRRTHENDPELEKWLEAQFKDRPKALSEEDDFTYRVPVAEPKFAFRKNILSYEDTAAIVAKYGGATVDKKWEKFVELRQGGSFQPASPPKAGHTATFITSGMFTVVNLGDSLIRGAQLKILTAYDEHGNIVSINSKLAKTVKESFVPVVYRLWRNGSYKIIKEEADLVDLLRKYIRLLNEMVSRQYRPLYNGDPTREEWDKLEPLIKGKRLPGRKQYGFLPAQKHAIITMVRVLRKFGYGILNGDMGTGKGLMQYGIAHSLNAFPMLVICPAHLVEKHKREAEVVLGPTAKPVIVNTLKELRTAVENYKPGDKLIVIAAVTKWSLGPGVHRVRVMRNFIKPEIDKETGLPLGKYVVKRLEACPRCGKDQPIEITESDKPVKCAHCKEPLYEYGSTQDTYDEMRAVLTPDKHSFGAWVDGQYIPATDTGKAGKWTKNAKLTDEEMHARDTHATHRWPMALWLSKHVPQGFFKFLAADEAHMYKGSGSDRGYAFQRLAQSVDYVLLLTGTLFGGYAHDLFYLLLRTVPSFRDMYKYGDLNDFVDTYGRRQFSLSKDDAESASYGASTGKRRHTTGSKPLPGISTEIYKILLQFTLFLRVSDLGYDMPQYNERMPALMMGEMLKKQYQWLYKTLYDVIAKGLSSRDTYAMKEARALLSTWLINTLLRGSEAFRTTTIMRPMDDVNKKTGKTVKSHRPFFVRQGKSKEFGYDDAADRAWLKETGQDETALAVEGDKLGQDHRGTPEGLLEQYADIVGKEPMMLYPTVKPGELLPKEQWLVDELKEQKARGRRCLVYVQQTGTRDIQQRLKKILAKHGIRAVVIPNGQASKREAWIKKNAADADVLITNPKKVETGLDLVEYATCIFYELPTSLFVMQQAMKRIFRLGQTKDVEVLIPHHMDKSFPLNIQMEWRILKLMATKAVSAAILYGDNATTAFAQAGDGADSMAEMAKQIMADAVDADQDGQMMDGIKTLLGGIVESEREAARAAREEVLALGEDAPGMGEYEEDEDDDDAFWDDQEEEEEEEDTMSALMDNLANLELPTDLFGAAEDDEPIEATPMAPQNTIVALDGTEFVSQPLRTKKADELVEVQNGGKIAHDGSTYVVEARTNDGSVYLIDEAGTAIAAMSVENLHTKYGVRLPADIEAKVTAARQNKHAKGKAEFEANERAKVIERIEKLRARAPEDWIVWLGKKFEHEGRTYEMPRRLDPLTCVGRPHASASLATMDCSTTPPIMRSWESIAAFVKQTQMSIAPEEDCTRADLLTLRDLVAAGNKVITATDIGLPTIHSMPGDSQHVGYGVFLSKSPEYEISWCGGGAMSSTHYETRTDDDGEEYKVKAGLSYTTITVDRGHYPYDQAKYLEVLDWWLNMPQPDPIPEMPEEPTKVEPEPKPEVVIIEKPVPVKAKAVVIADDDPFADWEMEEKVTEVTSDLSVLSFTVKKGGKKAARKLGADAFSAMMASTPTFE